MPTTIAFIGGEKITVSADLDEMADMLSRARPERVERVHGGPRHAYVNPSTVLYIEESHTRVSNFS